MFSKACEYAIKAVIYIATQSLDGRRVKVVDIAQHTDSPEAFTTKVLGKLVKHQLVNSLKGPNGGFEIDKQRMKEISIDRIVLAIDGDAVFTKCTLGLQECNHNEPCPMHHKVIGVRNGLKQAFETTTIYDLAAKFKSGKTILKS